MVRQDHLRIIERLLNKSGFAGKLLSRDLTRINGDGSDRIFYRIAGGSPLIAVFPGSETEKDLSEARSCYLIGTHLFDRGIPVPAVYGYDRDHGALLFEDCGDLHLHDALRRNQRDIDSFYYKTIDGLILLQLEGRREFNPSFCCDTPEYDMDLMLVKESGYFLSSFCRDYLGINYFDPGLLVECRRLARRAARISRDYLMHRDFQSRNILLKGEEIRIIDFQGARFGPLGYDIASLLIDPYAGLSLEQEKKFLEYYFFGISTKISLNQEEFKDGYYLLALQRNLQILGAFAYLSQIKGKQFFRDYINPALRKLHLLLRNSRGEDYPDFRSLIIESCERTGVSV